MSRRGGGVGTGRISVVWGKIGGQAVCDQVGSKGVKSRGFTCVFGRYKLAALPATTPLKSLLCLFALAQCSCTQVNC